jgi:signal transduction histidine kinase
VSEVVKLLSTEAETRRVAIDTGLSSERPYFGGDRTQIIEVLLNLAMNGMHAMEAVPAERRRLTFQTAKRDGEVVIAVRDRGCGISKQTMPRLFEPFFTTRSEGMGLGLSIAESIVQSHQGRVWAENNADCGATIYVSFPARPHEARAPLKSAVLPAV